MQSCSIALKNFRGYIEDSNKANNIPLVANNITLENYYSVANRAPDLMKDSSDIKTVFITKDKGIVAYQDQRGQLVDEDEVTISSGDRYASTH